MYQVQTGPPYRHYTDREIDTANDTDLPDLLNSLGYHVKRVGRYYTTREMDSLRIKGRRTWYRYSESTGGDAIEFLRHFHRMSFAESVGFLLTFNGYPVNSPLHLPIRRTRPPPQRERPAFVLPPPNSDNERVRAYLRGRGIAPDIISSFIEAGLLYEDTPYHNCVFVGRDSAGKPVFAAKRGTWGDFKGDAAGSDKSIDIVLLFSVYYFSKRKISKNTEPIMASIKTLSTGKPVDLSIRGELSEIADSVNQASQVLSRQNQARANWISGVSHDIRTPLAMIMGYAQRIAGDHEANGNIRQEAEIIRAQSAKIKDLVQDLNLVSQLEYEMQPLHKEPVRLSKLLRSYAADLLNAGISEKHSIEVEISPEAETAVIDCDARLISRAIGNLVQNSINHNPQGCDIFLSLDCSSENVSITVADNGVGMSAEKLRELEEKPHYMKSTDERLDLRHGLGMLLVRQIMEVHGGVMEINTTQICGLTVILSFQKNSQ